MQEDKRPAFDAFDTVDPVKLGPVSHGEPLLDIQKKA